jgi:uncharacterized DUF497 family protein
MELEWDEAKRRKTLNERHLDFADVVRFDHDTVVTWPDRRRDYGEPRFNSYGYLDGVLCTYCFTPRRGRVRVISMRKVNERERKRYEAGQDPGHA